MLLKILKKDILSRKGVNLILFLFITLATIFLSSSVSNILIVNSAVDYYMDYANVPDVNVIISSENDKNEIDTWLEKQKEIGLIDTYDYNQFLSLPGKSVQIKQQGTVKSLDAKGVNLYVSTMDVPYNQVYDEKGKSFVLKEGEIALSISLMNRNQLKIGDQIHLQIGNIEKEFTIQYKMKDAAFGSEMVGMSRLVVSTTDYKFLEKDASKLGLYYMMTPEPTKLSKELTNQQFSSIVNVIQKDIYQMVYLFDMVMAALLILVGICLILIALLVLRFTLLFTMEEQYQEIGILKAIGLKSFSIKQIFLVKYLAIVTIGALLGLCISIPVSNLMIAGISKNMIMANSSINIGVNLLCTLFVILIVMIFCYFCARRLNKVSAITAIRGGKTGERFEKQKGISLYKRKYLPIPLYLGCNDILSHLKRYAVLMITFAISFVLITIPLNTVNTIQSDEMISKFVIDPTSNILVRSIEQIGENHYSSVEQLKDGVERIKQELQAKDYQDISATAGIIYFLNYTTASKQKQNIMTLQLIGDHTNFAEYTKGSAPILENEVAFSEDIMKENKWTIGDHLEATINGERKTLIITGSYSDYMQLGKSARLNSKIVCDREIMFDYWSIMIYMQTDLKSEELKLVLQEQFPNYEWLTDQELVDSNVGGIQKNISDLLIPMTAMLCGIIMLITLLMEKLFITREKGEIAMLKSIGFSTITIRIWQILRMILVALVSMLVAVPLSLLSNQYMLKPIFALVGAQVTIQIDFWKVYFIFPGVLLLGIVIATIIATRGVKRIAIQEFNNME